MFYRKKDEGFTLVELMVVVLIIGILVAIAIPVFNAAKANAQRKSCYANQRTIEGSCGMYQADQGAFPVADTIDGTDVLCAGADPYLKRAPQCPATQSYYSINATGQVTSDDAANGSTLDHTYYASGGAYPAP